MSLDATKPTDAELLSAFAAYIRETRAAVNALVAGASDVDVTALTVTAGLTTLTVGTDLSEAAIEIIKVTGGGVAALQYILDGVDGQIKIFVFNDGNVSFVDADKSAGQFYLNHLPAYSNYDAAENDVLILINIGGNGTTVQGYWKEIYRQVAVK